MLVAGVAPGLLARRAGRSPVPTVDEPVVPGRPVVATRIRLERPFTDVDVGFGAAWVASQGALLRIDLRTNRVVATIPTPVSGENASIAFGEGAVWVTSGQANGVVYRVDPATNRVTATIGVPGGAFGIVVAAGTVWVTQYLPEPDPGIVARIDARTNQLRSPVQVPNMPGAIRSGLDAIWVTSRFTVSRIDPHSGAVTQPLHRAGDVRAVGGGSLWGTYANSAADAGVQRIDPGTGQVVATIRIPNGVLIAFGLGTLWVAQDASSITSGGNAPDRTEAGQAVPDRPRHQSGAGSAGPPAGHRADRPGRGRGGRLGRGTGRQDPHPVQPRPIAAWKEVGRCA